MFPFPKEAIDAAKAHANACFPNESCGYISNGEYVPCENQAGYPKREFDFAWPVDRPVEAVLHSHVTGKMSPSSSDMQGQLDTGVPWGIILANGEKANDPIWWGPGVPIAPLEGRPFLHGVTDCYSIIRDYYRLERGIELPDFARDGDWWKNGLNLYVENITRAGFKTIPFEEAQEGDVWLMRLLSDVPNHGGILLKNGEMIHHRFGRYSCRDTMHRWLKKVTHWLRYTGNENNTPPREAPTTVRADL